MFFPQEWSKPYEYRNVSKQYTQLLIIQIQVGKKLAAGRSQTAVNKDN